MFRREPSATVLTPEDVKFFEKEILTKMSQEKFEKNMETKQITIDSADLRKKELMKRLGLN